MQAIKSPLLPDLQRWMRWVLSHPHGVGCALKNHAHRLDRCLRVIGETPAVSRQTRLSIYGNGYFARIVEVLGSNFSSVKNALGENRFDEMARAYLVKHPSRFKSIDDIGHQMSGFLKKHPLAKTFPFLPDLAAIEWAAHRSFFADDRPPLKTERIQALHESEWKNAVFTFDPSVRLMKLDWPVDEIWRADGRGNRRRFAALRKNPINALVFRTPEKFVRVARLSEAQSLLLRKLSRRQPLAQALLAVSEKFPIRAWFKEWVEQGIFIDIE